jgi:L-ascorbate metabolism protein UlaG (beta-lactamase superfamily)
MQVSKIAKFDLESGNHGHRDVIDPVRAIIMRDCCLIFVPDGADSLLSSIQKRFQECVQEKDWDAPYEFR